MKIKILPIVLLLISAILFSCNEGIDLSKNETVENATNYIEINVRDYGVIKLVLYPETAPRTVVNFQKLVSEGFYDGLTFHRVISGFMIQCGDPTGTGLGGSDDTIQGEFAANGIKNDISHKRGVISMGRKSTGYDTASSHFFICHADATNLDGSYAAFGEVIEGMDVVDAIASVKTNSDDKPITDVIVESITFYEPKK